MLSGKKEGQWVLTYMKNDGSTEERKLLKRGTKSKKNTISDSIIEITITYSVDMRGIIV